MYLISLYAFEVFLQSIVQGDDLAAGASGRRRLIVLLLPFGAHPGHVLRRVTCSQSGEVITQRTKCSLALNGFHPLEHNKRKFPLKMLFPD